jgi:hypothetical protein
VGSSSQAIHTKWLPFGPLLASLLYLLSFATDSLHPSASLLTSSTLEHFRINSMEDTFKAGD